MGIEAQGIVTVSNNIEEDMPNGQGIGNILSIDQDLKSIRR